MRKIYFYSLFSILYSLFSYSAVSAAKKAAGAKGAAMVATTAKSTVRAKVSSGIEETECYQAYFGCMDNFCQSDNESGGSCMCSADYSQYEATMKKIEKNTDEASRIATIEVEKARAGANADILFNGVREYDKDGNVVNDYNAKAKKKAARQAELDRLFGTGEEDEDDEESEFSLAGLTGKSLYDGARKLCLDQIPEDCEPDMKLVSPYYQTQIKNDCTALGKVIKDLEKKSELAILDAQKDVRAAREEKFSEDNEYDRGTCMVSFKKCMMGPDACGSDWGRCASYIADENMQNKKAVSTANTKVAHNDKFAITDSVLEMLSSKRNICESVLNKCLATRDLVWTDFLRDVAPELKVAEAKLESGKRQSCLSDISGCIQKACKDDIEGKGVDSMDACLARPDMARSFCKVEIDPCERMEPQIWYFVVSKLASMRVDACTKEVKDCFTSDDRCGSDFSKCIGMDYKYLHAMCPVDKLVVCKQANKNFKLEDIDNMLMGFFMNVDNELLDQCQQLIDNKMEELCGSTTDCNKFAADDQMGTQQLMSQKDGTVYRVTGMISFGSIKMGNGDICDGSEDPQECTKENKLGFGEIGVKDYIADITKKNAGTKNAKEIISSIEAELANIAGTINRTIDLFTSDTKIQFCIEGRDLSQINGKTSKNNKTSARFPNLLNNQKQLIAASALRQAQDNYNKKLKNLVADAMKDASADMAQYMCQKMADGGGSTLASLDTPLAPPYSISYDVGSGLTTEDLMKGGSGTDSTSRSAGGNAGYLGGSNASSSGMNIMRKALFNRETRNCHMCTMTSVTNCKTSGSTSWVHNSRNTSCSTSEPKEKCEDIAM